MVLAQEEGEHLVFVTKVNAQEEMDLPWLGNRRPPLQEGTWRSQAIHCSGGGQETNRKERGGTLLANKPQGQHHPLKELECCDPWHAAGAVVQHHRADLLIACHP